MLYRTSTNVNFRKLFNLLVLSLLTATWGISVSAQSTDPEANGESDTHSMAAVRGESDELRPTAVIPRQTIVVGTPITPINLPHFTGASGTLTYSIRDQDLNSASPGELSSIGLAGLHLRLNDPSDTMYSGTISGTLTGTSRDDSNFTILRYIAEDTEGQDGRALFLITIVDPAPNFANSALIPRVIYTVGSPLSRGPLPMVQRHPSAVTYSLSPDLPPGLMFNANARTISGTPSARSSATEYAYTATDIHGAAATLTFTLEENTVPIPPNGPLSYTYIIGESFTPFTLPAFTGGNVPITHELSFSGTVIDNRQIDIVLPSEGITFDASTRRLIPSKQGTDGDDSFGPYSIHLVATDRDNDRSSVPLNITIIDLKPSVLTEGHSNTVVANKGEHLLRQLPSFEATDNTGNLLTIQEVRDYEATIVTSLLNTDGSAGVLPAGLNYYAPLGLIYGTPTTLQSPIDYIYRVVDEDGDMTDFLFTLSVIGEPDVIPPNTMPVAPTGAYTYTFTVGEHMTEQLPAFTGGDGELTYSIHSGGMTELSTILSLNGLTFDAATHTISGTLMGTAANDSTDDPHSITYRATDEDGDSREITIQINIVDSLPLFGTATKSDIKLVKNVSTDNLQSLSDSLLFPAVIGGTGTGDVTYSITDLPSGLTLDSATRRLRGTPISESMQTTYTYTATDEDRDRISIEFNITVEGDFAPTFSQGETIPTINATESIAFTGVTLPEATGGNAPIRYSFNPRLPPGLSFDQRTRMLTGTPAALSVQTETSYVYSATDKDGDHAPFSLSFILNIAQGALSVGNIPVRAITVGEAITAITLPPFSNGRELITYTLANEAGTIATGNSLSDIDLTNIGLPGLRYNSTTRVISGTIPDTPADDSSDAVSLTHRAVDADGRMGSTPFTITVIDELPSFGEQRIEDIVVVINNVLPMQTLHRVEDNTGTGNVRYSLSPALPDGLIFNATSRQLSGTPTTLKDVTTYTYTATDEGGDTDTLSFSLSVPNRVMQMASAIGTNGTIMVIVGERVSETLPDFTGGIGPYTYSLLDMNGNEVTNLAAINTGDDTNVVNGLAGLRYNSTTHTISGTIVDTAENQSIPTPIIFKHCAVDTQGNIGSVLFTMTVVDVIPSFGDQAIAPIVAIQNSVLEQVLPAVEGSDNPNITYTLGSSPALPTGLRFNASTRVVSGIPTALTSSTTPTYTYTYTYIATDADGDSASLTFTLNVAPSALRPLGSSDISINLHFLNEDGIPVSRLLNNFTGGTGTPTLSITDTNGVEFPTTTLPNGVVVTDLETAGLPGLTYNPTTRTISGRYRGTPANDNGYIDLQHKAVDSSGAEAVHRIRVFVYNDYFPELDTSAFNYFNHRTHTVPIDGEQVTLLRHFVYLVDDIILQLPREIEGTGNGNITYSLTSIYTRTPTQLGLIHDETRNTLRSVTGGFISRYVPHNNVHDVLVTATDADGDTARYIVTVSGQSPRFSEEATINIPTLTQSVSMDPVTLPMATASGYYSPLTYSLSPAVPPGLNFEANTRILSGTPTATQSATRYTYTVRSSERSGSVRRILYFTITVNPANGATLANQPDASIRLTPPVVEEMMVMSGREMAPVVLPAFTYDGPHDLVYSVTGLPQGIEFTPATRMLSGTPAVVGESAVSYIAEDNVRNAAATTFTLTVIDSTLTDATRSAIPAVSTSVAMAATASAAARIERALRGATQGLDISTAAGQSFQFNPSSSSGSSNSRRNPLRFGFWYNTATDELSDTRYEIATNSTTESSNFGFDVSLDFNPDTTLVLGVMQNNSATETEFSRVGGVGDEGALNLDLNSTALYAALGWRGLNVWAISGENDTQIADKASGVGLPVSFSYQTLGFSADFEVLEDLRIGARIETLQSDFNIPGVGRQLLGDLASAAAHTKATLTVNYEFELGKDSNGLLVPRFEFGTRNLSTSEQFQSTRSNARDTASELGFGLDYKQLDWGLTLGLDLRSMAVQNYSSKSMQWSVRWESGHYGKGLSLSLTPTTVAQTLGVDNIYNGDYGSYKSLVNRQLSDDSAEGVNVEMGVGLLSGTGTFTPFVKATNLYGSGASTQAFGVRYSAASSTSFEFKFTQQSRVRGSTNSLTSGISAASSSRSDLESALEFSTRHSF